MSRSLLILVGAAVFCDSPRTFAAVQSNVLWQLGSDDESRSPFRSERNGSTAEPGSPTVRDDDYYFAGTYPAPIGVLASDEDPAEFERSITNGDPRNRIHFPLSPPLITADSRLTLTVDLIDGGHWPNPGFGVQDVTVRFNGQVVINRTFTDETTLVATFSATSVNAVLENNVVEIERTGVSNGYLSFDYVMLEADEDGLADYDSDNIPRWYEEAYGLDDGNPLDATEDPDGDLLSNEDEFLAGTNPTDPDTDNDGLNDGEETTTNPLLADTDGDTLLDGAETTSDPLLTDTDSDTFPDNIEIEQGTDPNSASSTPFPFAGVISLHFVSERDEHQALQDLDPAGLFRFPNWNASEPLPHWYIDDTPLTGSLSNLKNCRGQTTGMNASWSYRYAAAGFHKGRSDERLLNGMITGDDTGSGDVPAELTLTGIPYATYDLIAYVGDQYPEARATVELDGAPSTRRYFTTDTAPPYQQWNEITATTEGEIEDGNYVRYRNLSGANQKIIVSQLDNDRVALHGVQIIDMTTDGDADGMPDAVEIEHGMNPAVHDASADLDSDGLNNAAELVAGTDPAHPDSDRDGLLDGDEATHNADPLDPDSDDDSLTDGDEVYGSPFPSLANDVNSDGDAFTDDIERLAGSDPMDTASTPPPIPSYNLIAKTWTWRIDNVRIRWNHSQSMLGALSRNDTTLFDMIVEAEEGGWNSRVSMGLYFDEGTVRHRFRCNRDVFHREGNSGSSHSSTGSDDISRQLGFSGYGDNDVSHPLRFEFIASRPTVLGNEWTITFTIYDVRDPGNPVTIATRSWENSVAAHSGLMNGSTPWTDDFGNPDLVSFDLEPGVDVFFTDQAISPADSDSDGMPNDWETLHAFNLNDPSDASLDADSDTLTNLQEFLAGTDPRDADSDNDGANDGVEIAHGTSPTSDSSYPAWIDFAGNADDLDGDGLSDAWMLWSGGKSRLASGDDDNDGMSNLKESQAGTDPDDPNSKLEMLANVSGNHLIIEWNDLPFKSHLVETTDLITGWNPLTGAPPPVSSRGMRKVTLINQLDTPSAFFRASVHPIDTDNDGVEDWIEENVLGSSVSNADSLGQSLVLSNSETLSGDARALLDRTRSGTDPNPGSAAGPTPSPVHAARFLMQATFGPTPEDIDEVRELGFDAWLDQQLTLPPSYLKPYIKEIQADAENGRYDRTYDYNEGSNFVTGRNFTTPWARNAVGAPDQLRQRVAFALSQILVVSRRDARLTEKPEAMTDYYDMLIEHAFGSYEELLLDVSLHPAMGWYLTSVGNEKADPSIPRFPDENYSREIMQLFSIGLWELNPDGTRKLDPEGEPIPTYDTADITELARVFTGLYYDAPYGWGGGGWAESHFLKPMVMYADRHDFGPKQLLNGFTIPEREPNDANGMQDVRDAVANLVNHPNTAPFISQRLIQFLVTDNPSPAYVGRVAAAFNNDGAGKRGNLEAVVRAILSDPEARNLPIDDNFGKVREPVIRTMHLGRLFGLAEAHPDFVWWNSESTYYDYSFQEPLYAPSVFNFFTPEYQAPGDIRTRGLVSPGFQIIDTYSSISFPNRLWDYLYEGFISSWNGPRYPLDYSDSLLAAEDLDILIDRIDLLVCTGNMTTHTRGVLQTTLADPELTPQDRLAVALWTTINSPEGATQR